MGWILEPGQSTILHTLSAEGTIREVSGLPTGVSTRPALPVDLAAGAELALVASQTPALGTFTIGFTVVYARPSGDPGSGELPPGHGHPPSGPGRDRRITRRHYDVDRRGVCRRFLKIKVMIDKLSENIEW